MPINSCHGTLAIIVWSRRNINSLDVAAVCVTCGHVYSDARFLNGMRYAVVGAKADTHCQAARLGLDKYDAAVKAVAGGAEIKAALVAAGFSVNFVPKTLPARQNEPSPCPHCGGQA